MTLVLSVAGYYFISHILQNALEQKAQALAEQVATTTIDAILLKEYGVIERMVNDLVIQTPDLHSIKIENQYQQVLADVEQTPANRIQKSSQSGLTIVKPLYFFGNPAGRITLKLSNESVVTPLRQLSVLALLALVMMLAALFFGVRRLLSIHVIHPIQSLCHELSSTQKIFYETLTLKEDLPAELCVLNGAIVDLQHALQNHIRSLKAAHQFTEQATQSLCQNQRLATIGQLAAGLAHNLNTPLANIIGYAQLAQSQTNDPVLQKRLHIIERQAKSCSEQVKNLLQASKPPALHLQNADLVSLTHKVIEMVRPVLKQHSQAQIRFEHPQEALSPIDIPAYEHILFNLINNAIEAQATQIRLQLCATKQAWTLNLCDNGTGVSETLKEKIFNPFVSAKTASESSNSGTGLGLFLSKTLLKQMQGDIELTRSEPGDTCFTLIMKKSPEGHEHDTDSK